MNGMRSKEPKTTTGECKVLALWTDWNNPGMQKKYGGVGWYRIINAFGKLGAYLPNPWEIQLGGKDREAIAQELAKYDVWVMKYLDDFESILHILTCRDVTGKKLVIDIDDDFWHVHPHNLAYKYFYPGSEKMQALTYLIQEADAIICSTQPLASVVREHNRNVFVLENSQDTSLWEKAVPKTIKVSEPWTNKDDPQPEIREIPVPKKDKVRIGWVMSANHEQDIPAVIEGLKEILKRDDVEFWHIGWDSDQFAVLPKGKHLAVWGTDFENYPSFLRACDLDIALCPLIDDKFNQSKSNIKWQEATMAGVPVVASDVKPYQNILQGKTGYLAKSTSQWVKYLTWLIENPKKRQEIAENAKKDVLAKWEITQKLPEYEKVIKTIYGQPSFQTKDRVYID